MFLQRFVATLLMGSLICCSKEHQPPAPPAAEVTDFLVEPKTIPIVFEYVGFVQSAHPVEIRGRVEGYLDKIAYVEGNLVHEGDLLFQLDPKQYQAKVEEAKGEVARQQAILENAKLTVNRLQPLYEQKAASKKDLDNAIATQLSAIATLQTAQAQLLDSEINLGYTTITSPITGIADKSQYREGALITPGPNSLLTTVSTFDPIWVYFTISDTDIERVKQQEEQRKIKLPHARSVILPKENEYIVELVLSDGTIYPYKGRVDFAAPTYDQSTGTLLARAVFENPKLSILPGQFVRVKVYGAKRPNALFVPRRALLQKKSGMYVYLITNEGKVVAQDVSLGDWYDDFQIITNGLKEGDRILVDGIGKVRPGMPVTVVGNWKEPASENASQPAEVVE